MDYAFEPDLLTDTITLGASIQKLADLETPRSGNSGGAVVSLSGRALDYRVTYTYSTLSIYISENGRLCCLMFAHQSCSLGSRLTQQDESRVLKASCCLDSESKKPPAQKLISVGRYASATSISISADRGPAYKPLSRESIQSLWWLVENPRCDVPVSG